MRTQAGSHSHRHPADADLKSAFTRLVHCSAAAVKLRQLLNRKQFIRKHATGKLDGSHLANIHMQTLIMLHIFTRFTFMMCLMSDIAICPYT